MSTSHIAVATLPSTSNYVLTSIGTNGRGIWSNPAVNPLITAIVPQYITTTYSHFVSDNNSTVVITLRSDGFHVICDITSGTGTVTSTTPRMWLGDVPSQFNNTSGSGWFGTAQLINNAVQEVGQFSLVGNGGMFIELENANFIVSQLCGLLSQTWTWPINSPSLIISNEIKAKSDMEIKIKKENQYLIDNPPSTTDELQLELKDLIFSPVIDEVSKPIVNISVETKDVEKEIILNGSDELLISSTKSSLGSVEKIILIDESTFINIIKNIE